MNDSPDRYQRQSLFAPLGDAGNQRLRDSSVVIVGCGALGSHVAVLLTRAGVGRLRLVDRDVVEWSNLHRQVGFEEADAREGRPKAVALADALGRANSEVEIDIEVAEFNYRSAARLARDVDLIVDGTDNLPARFVINDLALETRLPWVYGGAVGQEAHAQLFVPGAGPCLRCVVPELPPPGSLPTCDTAGVIGPAPAAAASFQAALAMRCLVSTTDNSSELAGLWVRLRLWDVEATVSRVRRDPECPACFGGERPFLRGERNRESLSLCGRDAVQVYPAEDGRVDLEGLADRLRGAGEVQLGPYLLRFRPRSNPHRLTLFRDGRAIVDGTGDRELARALYDRFVGQ